MTYKRSLTSLIARIHERTSLTLKVVLVTVLVGLFLWALLDYVQSSKLKKIFYVRLVEKLTEQSMIDRIHFNRNINFYHKSVRLFVTQKNFIDYIEKQKWSTDDSVQIKYYRRTPPWFQKPSILRLFAHPRFALLLDSSGRVREVYLSRHDTPLPPSLLQPTSLMLLKSHEQSFISKLDNSIYLIASESYSDAQGELSATLMLATPIDDEFLITSVGTFSPGRLVALVNLEKEPRIITSSDLVELPEGTPLSELQDRYLITGQQTYDYGAAEYIIRLASFISMSEVDKLSKSVIMEERRQRNIIAPVFIITLALIMFWITQRINRLNRRMSDFSQQTLGAQKKDLEKGDQLFVLENRFQRFTEEIIEARDMLKRQAEEQTRLIVNSAFDAIIAMNVNGVISTWNPQAEVIFGWRREEAVGRRVSETIVPLPFRKAHEKGIKHFLSKGEGPIFNMQFQITALRSDGKEFPIELSISPARSGSSYIFIAIIRDITERVEAEEELKRHRSHLQELVTEQTAELTKTNRELQKEIIEHKLSEEKKARVLKELAGANQELKDFAYIVSHDLKAPLRAMSTLANWISVDYRDRLDNKGREQLSLLIKRTTRMNDLINGILEYSKVGRIKEKKVEVDLEEVVREVIDAISPPGNIDIRVEGKLPSVFCEKTRISEVFQNLLSNAVNYMDKLEGVVRIGCVEGEGYWKFNVSDNGPGIEEKYFEKIFQIFQTLSPVDEQESTGIGLTLVKKIITMYGGEIWVESEVGRGSTFFFTLPKEQKTTYDRS